MKSTILALAIAGCFGGALQASTVVSCGWSPTALNSCNGQALPNFTSQLDWAAFGLDGTTHSGLWTASLNSGMTITVSTINVDSTTNEGARTASNFGSVPYNGSWYNYASSHPYYAGASFTGHFNAPTSLYSGNYSNFLNTPGEPGDHLMGLAGNGDVNGNPNRALVIDLGANLTDFAFRIAAVNLSSFNVTMSLYSGANGTGTLIGSGFSGLTNLSGGGNCAGLVTSGSTAPTPCNDANLIAAMNLVNVRSIQLQTNDPSGFFIGDLYYNTSTPEPTPFVFAGCGLILLVVGRRKFRKA